MSSLNISGAHSPQSNSAYKPGNIRSESDRQACDETSLSFDTRDEKEKTLFEMLDKAREKAKKQREKFKLPKTRRYGDLSVMAYARLSRARTQGQVSSAAGYARRGIAQLEAAKRQDKDNARRIQAVINQLKKVVFRASKKKTELQRERLDEIRRDHYEADKQRRKAQRINYQLQKNRVQRKIRESGYISEAVVDNHQQDAIAKAQADAKEQMQTLIESAPPATGAAIQQYLSQIPAETCAPAPDISVQA